MKPLALLLIASFLVFPFVAPALAEDKLKPQTVCPVEGGKIIKTIFVDQGGFRVYFCCKECPDKFKAEPAKFLDKMKAEGIELEKAPKLQTNCPVMGGKVDKKVFVDHEGSRVYFCCNGCPEKFKADPAKFLDKLKVDGIELEKTPVAEEEKAAMYSCPMHPEVQSAEPGNCPKCGMELAK